MIKTHWFDEKINIFYFLYLCGFLIVTSAMALCIPSSKAFAEQTAIKEKLVIISPYPKKFIDGFRRAFEQMHPEYTVQVHKMKTKAGLDYLRQKKGENTIDLFWATSTDAYEILKAEDLLAVYKPNVSGIPEQIAGIPIFDTEYQYAGFAFTGVGLMWNILYLRSNEVKPPKNWIDLTHPQYANLIGMSSPSRSGTTHVAVESILQTHGWDKGWRILQQIGGNLRQVTMKSAQVPRGVKNGQFGVGIVVDYYGLSAKAKHFPVDFSYTRPAIMFPASIAMIKDAPHAKPAQLFIDFLLSLEGQHLLLHKEVSRLPIRMASYESAPDGYPNPFQQSTEGETFILDFSLSKSRYTLVNILFDSLITFNLKELKTARKTINQLEVELKKQPHAKASTLLEQAKQTLYRQLVSEEQSLSGLYNTKLLTKPALASTERTTKETQNIKQTVTNKEAFKEQWQQKANEHYKTATRLAEEGLTLLAKTAQDDS